MSPQKWTLISANDVSPSKWFPIEERTYKLPDGRIVNDFSVTTLADVAMIIPVTKDGKIIMVNQFKPSFDDVILEFPAGRTEPNTTLEETALRELEEEAGIKTGVLEYFATLAGFVTKGTEKVSCFLARDIEINSQQKLDEIEDIEIMIFNPEEIDQFIYENKIQAAITVAAWTVAKAKFSELGG